MLLALASAFLAVVPQQAPVDTHVDFPALAKQFQAARCPPGETAPCKLDAVLTLGFAHVPIGPFDLEVPMTMLGDKLQLEYVRTLTRSLASQVQHWAKWQGAQTSLPPEAAAAWPAWVGRWKPIKPADLAKATSRELVDLFAATEAERAAIAGMEQACDDAKSFALTIPEGRQIRLILAPTRLDFMQWVGYSGVLDESLKSVNWYDEASQWTQIWLGWDLILALEYAPWDGFDPTFKASQPMVKVGDGIMAQHVVQQATFGLLRSCRPSAPEARFETALAMLMTIAVCGEINTVEGAGGVSSSGAKTQPYSRFIPGGNPKGGTLPGRSAKHLSMLVESRWRKGHGKDGFVTALKGGQAESLKASKGIDHADQAATFVMHQEDGTGKHFVHAPFFGPHADEQEYPPGEYLVDFAEFYRAYKSGFFHWLAHHGVDSKNPGVKWAELIRGLPTLNDQLDFDALVAKVYGLPISAKDGSTDSLEWRFLKFVTKSK